MFPFTQNIFKKIRDVRIIDLIEEHKGSYTVDFWTNLLNIKPYERFFFNIVKLLISIRLLIMLEPIAFIIINFTTGYWLLFNQMNTIKYTLSLILILSRILFYFIDDNYTEIKMGLQEFNYQLEEKNMKIALTRNNITLVTFWILRGLTMPKLYSKEPIEFDRSKEEVKGKCILMIFVKL